MSLPEALVQGGRRYDFRRYGDVCLWLRGDAYSLSGSNVQVLRDQSGAGNDMIQMTPANQIPEPLEVPFFHGRKAFYFDADKLRYYERRGSPSAIHGWPFAQTPYTVFAVCSRASAADANSSTCVINWQADAGIAPTCEFEFTALTAQFRTETNDSLLSDYTSTPADTANIWCLQYNNTFQYQFKNNVPVGSGATGAFSAPTNPMIRIGNATDGAPTPFTGGYHGHIAEIVIIKRFLTAQERTKVFNDLGGYYNIPVAGSWGGQIG